MTSLQHLSSSDLVQALHMLVRREREVLHDILLHIQEVDRRRLFLDRSRSSLFDYLTGESGYSASAAQRRITAMHLLKDVPGLLGKIQQGEVHLTQIGEMHRAFQEKERTLKMKITAAKKKEILQKVCKKSSYETQKIVAQALDLELKPFEQKRVQKDNSVSLQLTLTQDQYEKLMQARDLLSHALLNAKKSLALADVIEKLSDQCLQKKLGKEGVGLAKKLREEGRALTH